MRVVLAAVPKEEIRANQVGDWLFDKEGRLTILVDERLQETHQYLVAIHELFEAMLCALHGVDQDQVTAFDEAFEGMKAADDDAEPGDDDSAPYFNEHQAATKVEKLCAKLAGITWPEYDKSVMELYG